MRIRILMSFVVFSAAELVCANEPVVTNVKPDTAGGKPNVLFVFTDDQAVDTIRAMGNSEIQTPNFDRLVHSGTTFTHCYNMGSWSPAVCVASRSMLLSGRSVWRAQKIYDTAEQEREAGRWWPSYLKGAGYRTYLTGKWHVKASPEKSFDVVRHVRGGMPKEHPDGYNRPLADRVDPWSPSDPRFGGFWEGGRHWSEIVADDAVDFLRQAADEPAPFFMYVAFNAPHDPRQSPREFVEMYPPEKISLPVNFLPEYPFKDLIGCEPTLRDEKLAPFPRTERAIRVHRAEYYAIVSHLDRQIGRILDALKASGKEQNTWIFFTADHGLAVGRHGLVGKQNLYEHSVRVPFVAVGPKAAAGERIDAPIYLQDVMPTALELAGVEKPAHVEFHSLVPLLEKRQTSSSYEAIYGAYLGLQRMIEADGYKLIVYPNAKTLRLYHVADDPYELKDLAGDPQYRVQITRLAKALRKAQQQTGDALSLAGLLPDE
ncbi:sulfatase-like hydrolase/transferase [Schlesneria paludicola]|uniref:sulfatase-like hydrolase/transferase n=1 Tax=Schlesneria paludicola TaxID=360056 RepID=UPI00029ACA7E|nr:sulfatase-like hydrolase/transferase [Schlesneria paludicola]